MPPRAIIFDYGNVLEGPLNEEAFESDLAKLAWQCGLATGGDLWSHLYICDAWEKAKRGQMTRADYWKDRLEALGILDEQAGIEFKQRLYRHRGLRAEMHQLLRELHGRYRLAVLSNTSRPELATYLAERRGLAGLFDVVISSAEAGLAKPEPAIYRLALRRLGVKPNEALFIDDLARNTHVAESIGIPSIIFTTPAALRHELEAQGIL